MKMNTGLIKLIGTAKELHLSNSCNKSGIYCKCEKPKLRNANKRMNKNEFEAVFHLLRKP